MRWILLSLLIVNVCYFLWQWLQGPDVSPDYPDLPVAPTVELLEQDVTRTSPGAAAQARPQQRDAAGTEAVAMRCARLGPFRDEQQRRRVRQALGDDLPLALQSSERSGETLYRALLPPFEDTQAAVDANAALRDVLERRGLAIDSFVMRSGEAANGISLGLFSQRDNALTVQRQLSELDYAVELREEQRPETVYWLLAKGGLAVVELGQRWSAMSTEDDSLQVTENLCETFAPTTDFP